MLVFRVSGFRVSGLHVSGFRVSGFRLSGFRGNTEHSIKKYQSGIDSKLDKHNKHCYLKVTKKYQGMNIIC